MRKIDIGLEDYGLGRHTHATCGHNSSDDGKEEGIG
jgi:hypothetical protein